MPVVLVIMARYEKSRVRPAFFSPIFSQHRLGGGTKQV
jgi:hypothetical protein